MNRYLEERKRRLNDMRSRRDRMMNDMRMNDYGRDYGDYRRNDRNDYGYDYRRNDYGNDYGNYSRNRDRDYGNDYGEDDEMDEDYKKDLKEWITKLKAKDKYGMTSDQIIQQGKSLGASFKGYDEMEFYATTLMMISDYKDISNDPMMYIRMAKDFLEDSDSEVSPSEKLCIYMYKIAKGE
jgi:hypothetical protein